MRAKPEKAALQAVGSFEAAALMGLHFATPAKMVEKGMLSAHQQPQTIKSATGLRRQAIFDGRECEENFLDYQEKFDAAGGKTDRRPRAHLRLRPIALRHLAKVADPIAFEDAIGVAEAAEILHVHVSFIPRMVKAGEIVGRAAWGQRRAGFVSRHWIVSRSSCLENVRKTRQLQTSGKKIGRRRNLS